MKKVWVFAVIAVFALQGSAYGKHIKGSGRVVKETRNLQTFESIKVNGVFDLNISQNSRQSLTIETDDNIMKYISTKVSQGRLTITFEPDQISVEPTKKILVTIEMAKLSGVEVEGVANVNIARFTTDRLRLAFDGVGAFTAKDLKAKDLDVVMDGSGTVSLGGDAGKQTVQIEGSGQYKSGDLKSRSAKVVLNGTGGATVWVEESLDAKIDGVGDISYYGNPKNVRQTIDGVGGVKKLGGKK